MATETNPIPQVIAVDERICANQGSCRELQSQGGAVQGLTVNGRSNGVVYGVNGRLQATIHYYGSANKDHMPIPRNIVDFCDGKTSSSTGPTTYIKNRRGTQRNSATGSEQSLCDATEWGKTTQSCDQVYFENKTTVIAR